MSNVDRAWREIVSVLDDFNIAYAIIGGLAVRAYGIPRPTYDIDFTLAMPRERLGKFYTAVEQRGFTVPESYRAGWVDSVAGMPLVKISYPVEKRSVDVDVFLAETEFQHQILERKILTETPTGAIWLASPEDVVLLKLVAYRPRDISDIIDVLFTQGGLDTEYLAEWAAKLGVADRLEEVLRDYDELV